MTTPIAVIGVPPTPTQTITIPIPADTTSLVLLLAFGVSELLPFVAKKYPRFHGVIQSIVSLISVAKPFRREDEALEQLRAELEELKATVAKRSTRRTTNDGT